MQRKIRSFTAFQEQKENCTWARWSHQICLRNKQLHTFIISKSASTTATVQFWMPKGERDLMCTAPGLRIPGENGTRILGLACDSLEPNTNAFILKQGTKQKRQGRPILAGTGEVLWLVRILVGDQMCASCSQYGGLCRHLHIIFTISIPGKQNKNRHKAKLMN